MTALKRGLRAVGGAVYRRLEALESWRFRRKFRAEVHGHHYLGQGEVAPGGNVFYEATSMLAAELAFRRLSLRPGDVFADVGCGKGAALLLAAEHDIARAVGVDLEDELTALARANVERNRDRLRAREVDVVTADALQWPIPDDLSVLFLYSPFIGDVFARFIDRLLASYDANPRPLRLVYSFPWESEHLLATGRFRVVDVRPGDVRIRPRWWTRAEVIVTYHVVGADGSAPPIPLPRRVNRRAVAHWQGPNNAHFILARPGVPKLQKGG